MSNTKGAGKTDASQSTRLSRAKTEGGKLPISKKRADKVEKKSTPQAKTALTKGETKGENKLMSKASIEQRAKIMEHAGEYSLAQVGKSILKLSETVEKRLGEFENNLAGAKANLNRSNLYLRENEKIPAKLVAQVTGLLDEGVDLRKDLMASVTNSLRAMHKAIVLIDQKGTDERIIQSMANLGAVQEGLSKILSKPLQDLTTHDLDDLKLWMNFSKAEVELLKKDPLLEPLFSSLSPDDKSRFEKQLSNLDAMASVFDDARKIWEGSLAPEKEKGLGDKVQDFVKDHMKTVSEANLKDLRFWGSLSALFGVLAVGVIVATAVLAVSTTTGFVGGMPVWLAIFGGSVLGLTFSTPFLIPAGVFGGFAFDAANADTAMEHRLKKYLEDTQQLMTQLKDANDQLK